MTHVFRATELRASETRILDSEEVGLSTRTVPLEEVVTKIHEGIVKDGATIAAVQLAAV